MLDPLLRILMLLLVLYMVQQALKDLNRSSFWPSIKSFKSFVSNNLCMSFHRMYQRKPRHRHLLQMEVTLTSRFSSRYSYPGRSLRWTLGP